MRSLTRRDFLRLCGATGAALGLSNVMHAEIIEAFSGPVNGHPPVVWLQGGSCSGCSVSLLNSVSPDIGKVLTDIISLKFHQTLMAAAGEPALAVLDEMCQRYAGQYYLVVEGAVPVGDGCRAATLGEHKGQPITFEERVRKMAAKARAVMAVGTCAAYGGIPAAGINPTSSKAVKAVVRKMPVVNVPGCPSHPDWVLGTLMHLIKYGLPELDKLQRPLVFFGKNIHDICERRPDFDRGRFATKLSEPGCLYKLGCKGPMTYGDCADRKFNNRAGWCVGANSPCLACTGPEFPDESAPFFEKIKEYGPAGTPSPQPPHTKIFGGEH